jgi:hypothetical protein
MDNEKIFNSGDPFNALMEITYEDSLFYTLLFHRLFGTRNSKNLQLFSEIESSLQSYCALFFSQLNQIIENIPEDWGVDRTHLKHSLTENLFSENWMDTVKKTFLQHASLMTQNL